MTLKRKIRQNVVTNHFQGLVENNLLVRQRLLNKLLDTRRDIDDECGYPKNIRIDQYQFLYEREGIATRVVQVFPEECWKMEPNVYETEDQDNQTAFELAFEELSKDKKLFSYLERLDVLCGIGSFGLLVIGLNDGQPLSVPVDGFNLETGEVEGTPQEREITYLRVYPHSAVTVDSFNTDETSPRYGLPEVYTLDIQNVQDCVGGSTGTETKTVKVHWTRVIHVADNKESSEVFGAPRMRPVYNRIYDLRKILSGSGEMFWKGAFPGISFEITPDLDVEIDKESLRTEMTNYMNGLQRYLAVEGMSAKSLAPQVASPEDHFMVQLKAISIAVKIPLRILIGSEQAQLASGQDAKNWNGRVTKRRESFVTPEIINPVIDRLIAFGVLPEPAEYNVDWPDLDTPSDQDKAEVAKSITEALAKYVASGADAVIPPLEYLTLVLDFEPDEAVNILEAAVERAAEIEQEEEEKRQQMIEEGLDPLTGRPVDQLTQEDPLDETSN